MRRLLIIGASGHGRVVADIAKLNGYDDIAFLDDNESINKCGRYPVLGRTAEAAKMDSSLFVAVGNATARKRLMEEFGLERCVTLIHPSAIIAEETSIGSGSVIMPGTVINPGTRIGIGCIINTCSSVDHDCQLENYVHISVGVHISGTVLIGQSTWVGAGATISNNITVAKNTIIGAGAVVVKDILEQGVYVGVPAKKIR